MDQYYTVDDVPTTVTWINGLNAVQAREQCLNLNIQPDTRLENNRVLLKKFVESRNRARQCEENILQRALSRDLLSLPASPTGPTVTTERVSPNLAQGTQTVSSNSPPGVFTEPTLTMSQLVQDLHSMTMQAVAATVQSITDQMKQHQPHTNDISIPPFVRDMLKEIQKTDGSDISKTVAFLTKVDKLVELEVCSERGILLNTSSQTLGRFREFWMEAMSLDLSWAELLAKFTSSFLTPEALRAAQNSLLYRQQGPTEHLSDFVKDIRTFFRILSPHTSQSEVFEVVFRGIHPSTRNTFAGLQQITSLHDLLQIAPFSTSIREQAANSSISQQSVNQSDRQTSDRPFRAGVGVGQKQGPGMLGHQAWRPRHFVNSNRPRFPDYRPQYFPPHQNFQNFSQPRQNFQNFGQPQPNFRQPQPSHRGAFHQPMRANGPYTGNSPRRVNSSPVSRVNDNNRPHLNSK